MGNGPIFECGQNARIMTMKQSDYQVERWPNDDLFKKSWRLHFKDNQELANKQRTLQVWKRKTFNQWYCGDWAQSNWAAKDSELYAYGYGILYDQEKEYVYIGNFQGSPNGHGKCYFANGSCYEGQIQGKAANGEGVYSSHNGKLVIKGVWKNSSPYYVTITVTGPTLQGLQMTADESLVIIFHHNQQHSVEITYPDGRVYRGEVDKKTFAPNGFGRMIYPDQGQYEGHWKEGKLNGQGKFTWKDRSSYQGQYRNGQKDGEGIFTFASGNYYSGYWSKGKRHGRGQMCNKLKQVYKSGRWSKGEMVEWYKINRKS